MKLKTLELKDISVVSNGRAEITKESIQDLAMSIKENGLIHPIVVRLKDKKYELIAGHRRLKALQVLKMKVTEATVIEADDKEFHSIQMTENLQRKDYDPFELAKSIEQFLQVPEVTYGDIALKLGFATRYIQRLSKLSNLLPEIRKQIKDDGLQFEVALEIATMSKPLQKEFAANLDAWDWRRITIKDIKEFMTEKNVPLNRAIFKLDDKTLMPIGACNTCPMNTIQNPDFFMDSKKINAACLDVKCFVKKSYIHAINTITQMHQAGENIALVKEYSFTPLLPLPKQSFEEIYKLKLPNIPEYEESELKFEKKAGKNTVKTIMFGVNASREFSMKFGKVRYAIVRKKAKEEKKSGNVTVEKVEPKEDPKEMQKRFIRSIEISYNNQDAEFLTKLLKGCDDFVNPEVNLANLKSLLNLVMENVSEYSLSGKLPYTGFKHIVEIANSKQVSEKNLLSIMAYLLFANKAMLSNPDALKNQNLLIDAIVRISLNANDTKYDELLNATAKPYEDARTKKIKKYAEKTKKTVTEVKDILKKELGK